MTDSLNLPIHPTLPSPLGIHVCSLHLCLYFCFANKVTCIIFLDSIYKYHYTNFFPFLTYFTVYDSL